MQIQKAIGVLYKPRFLSVQLRQVAVEKSSLFPRIGNNQDLFGQAWPKAMCRDPKGEKYIQHICTYIISHKWIEYIEYVKCSVVGFSPVVELAPLPTDQRISYIFSCSSE